MEHVTESSCSSQVQRIKDTGRGQNWNSTVTFKGVALVRQPTEDISSL